MSSYECPFSRDGFCVRPDYCSAKDTEMKIGDVPYEVRFITEDGEEDPTEVFERGSYCAKELVGELGEITYYSESTEIFRESLRLTREILGELSTSKITL